METLDAVSVLCVDKIGTIIMNQMTVQETWAADGDAKVLCEAMGLGCETDAYDPMEKAMLSYCEKQGLTTDQLFSGRLITEYAFTNEQKMMGHVWQRKGEIILAAKDSPERLLALCKLTDDERRTISRKIDELSGQGLRINAVGVAFPQTENDVPAQLTDCTLTFRGLIGLADPPRETVSDDIARCRKAGIRVVMITGDNGRTAAAIAEKIGMPHDGKMLTGDMLQTMPYVFTIHIPIALTSLLAPLLGIASANLLLLPLHVVLLELIIDPTCSIVLERQPAERDIMERKPRNPNEKMLSTKLLLKSVIQGLVIFGASFGTYLTVLSQSPQNGSLARAMGLSIIMLANLFLVQVNSSERISVFQSAKKLLPDKVMWIANAAILGGVLAILYTPLNGLLKLSPLSAVQLLEVVGISAVSVLWYEIWKCIKRARKK